LNRTTETIRPLEENMGEKPLDISLSNVFLDLRSKAKIKKWDYIKLKTFFTAKETINKMERQPTQFGKIFANHIPDKVLITKINKELIQLSSKKIPPNNPI